MQAAAVSSRRVKGDMRISRFSKGVVSVSDRAKGFLKSPWQGKKNPISGEIYCEIGNEENFIFSSLAPGCPGSLASKKYNMGQDSFILTSSNRLCLYWCFVVMPKDEGTG